MMVEKYLPYVERIKNLEVHDDDVWICSFPKCGTTWTAEMVWMINNSLDFERSKTIGLHQRVRYLE
jgi:hypothetical protein